MRIDTRSNAPESACNGLIPMSQGRLRHPSNFAAQLVLLATLALAASLASASEPFPGKRTEQERHGGREQVDQLYDKGKFERAYVHLS